jgi:thiosulfate dehydrogenase [quinone] large subunit
LAARAFITGIEKFAGTKASEVPVVIDGEPNTLGLTSSEADKVYGLSHYHGVPEALYPQLAAEPLIPGFAMKLYDLALGPLLLILGLTVLLGIATRVSLFAMGLVYTSLTVGLILLGQDAGIAWLGIHILMIAAALFNVKHNCCELALKKW